MRCWQRASYINPLVFIILAIRQFNSATDRTTHRSADGPCVTRSRQAAGAYTLAARST
jgi:hypothetical protein